MIDRGITASVVLCPHSPAGREQSACIGIEGHALTGAPGDELIRVYYDANDPKSGGLGAGMVALGTLLPCVVTGREMYASTMISKMRG